jgi:hypothetical protein
MYMNLCDGLRPISHCQSYEAASLCHKLAHIGIHTTLSYIHTYIHSYTHTNKIIYRTKYSPAVVGPNEPDAYPSGVFAGPDRNRIVDISTISF